MPDITKTYNMGRVVGWSNYEEFLKENPNIDPSKITSKVYSTMVTYGVTKVITLPSLRDGWEPAQGEDTVFYTTSVRCSGATYGAVPIVGVNYDYYVRTFKFDKSKYSEATETAGANKELLQKAFNCIFTCYVSDGNGNRTESELDPAGYLTFAAHPDIVDYLDAVSALIAPEEGLKVIVRGLSLDGLSSAEELYYGPQGLIVANGGKEAEYCQLETVDISALCCNASGYIWMSTGSGAPASGKAPFAFLTGHPDGNVLISTFGYLNPDMITGTGDFAELGSYAYTYEQIQAIINTPGWYPGIDAVQLDALKAVSEDEPKKYLYLLAGEESYSEIPPNTHPMFVIPVRKSDYYVNVGTFDWLKAPKLKRKLSFLKYAGSNYDRMLIIPNKVLPNYIGDYWGDKNVPIAAALNYWGTGTLNSDRWISTDLRSMTGVQPTVHGRTSMIKSTGILAGAAKGDFIVAYNQSEPKLNGIYQCVVDPECGDETDDGKTVYLRRGAWLSSTAVSVPSWASGWWQADIASGATKTITSGVLYINGTQIYPGELVVIGGASTHNQFFVINTIESGSPRLILSEKNEFSVEISSPTVFIAGSEDSYTNYISIERAQFQTVLTSITQSVKTGSSSTQSFTITNTEFTPGVLFDIKHQEATAYGFNKWYRYVFMEDNHGVYKFASGEVFTSNSNLSNVAGHPGTYNAAFPCYGQSLPTAEGSWHYNAPAAMSHISAKKMFQDLGYNIANYVHEDFQEFSVGKFLQECILRTDLSVAASESTIRNRGVESTERLYSKSDLRYTSGNVPTPTASNPIRASLILHASTPARSYFSTAYYTATTRDGDIKNINNSDYPIWASVSQSPEGDQIMSVSVTDSSNSQLDFSGNSGTIEADTVTWLDLLVGLGSGKSVDVLKGARFGRGNNNCNYLQTADGTRLYISTTAPTGDIPEGSIGIGW